MVEFRIPRGQSTTINRIITMDSRRAGLGLFRDLLGRISWDTALEMRGIPG